MDINEKLKELRNVIMKNLGVTSEEIEAKSKEIAEETKMDIRKMLIPIKNTIIEKLGMTPEEFEVKQKEMMMRKEPEFITEKSELGTESISSKSFSDQTDQIVADDHQKDITEEKVGSSSQPFEESVSSNSHDDEIIVAKNDLNCKDAGSIAENSAANDVLSGSKYEEAGSIQDEETDEFKDEEITNIEEERTETDGIKTNDENELKIFGVRRNWMKIGPTNRNVLQIETLKRCCLEIHPQDSPPPFLPILTV